MSAQEIHSWNTNPSHRGRSFVITSGGDSHFMTAENWITILEQVISPALELQRQRYTWLCSSHVYCHVFFLDPDGHSLCYYTW